MMKTVFLVVATAALGGFCRECSASEIVCEGRDYPYHLQGVATDGTNIYWTFTTVLVKTDLEGRRIAKFDVNRDDVHMGDLSCRKGRVYVGIGRGRRADGSRVPGEVWEMNADTLAVERTFETPEAIWCNNGLAWWDGSWWVISSAPKGFEYNILAEYDENFVYRDTHLVKSGWTLLGVQTILPVGDRLLLGTYSSNTIVVDGKALRTKKRDVSRETGVVRVVEKCSTDIGMLMLGGRLYAARQKSYHKKGAERQQWGAKLVPLAESPALLAE